MKDLQFVSLSHLASFLFSQGMPTQSLKEQLDVVNSSQEVLIETFSVCAGH